ncbi:MAG: HAMP domain-containing sensor histidine kinase [Acidimicrobiia bacterium]
MHGTTRTAEVDLLVAAVPVPVLVVDYTPIIARFEGMEPESISDLLLSDDTVMNEVIKLPVPVAASPEWTRLYGSPYSEDAPDLDDRHFTHAAYPDLYESLVQQFSAPFFGRTSIVTEHKAPTLFGDVTVRSHWRAQEEAGRPLWHRIVIVDLDVTDLRNAQSDLEKLLEMKEHLVESKDQLIASVSHEIRTPLASIVGFVQLLRDTADLAPDEREEMLQLLVQQSADLTNIVDDLLVAAKTDIGELEISRVPVDLKAQAAQAVESLDFESRSRLTLPKEVVRCFGDPARVRQIVRNLLSNAFKYGGPRVVLETADLGGVGALRVSDDGDPIADENRELIFEAYQRGDAPVGMTHSLGLGLHISRTLARRMGGDLTYRHADGMSTFELTLPLAEPAAG